MCGDAASMPSQVTCKSDSVWWEGGRPFFLLPTMPKHASRAPEEAYLLTLVWSGKTFVRTARTAHNVPPKAPISLLGKIPWYHRSTRTKP